MNGIIKKLKKDEVFVFGSNMNGFHSGGAAKLANEKFGAIWGKSEGPQGKSYAICTLDTRMNKVSLNYIKWQLEDLVKYAKSKKDKIFLLTPVGTGIAGFSLEEIESILPKRMPKNIIKIWKN